MNMVVMTVASILTFGLLTAGPADVRPDERESGRGWLGVYSENPTEAVRIALGIEHGVLVAEVAEGSPAAEAGLRSGDVILEVDGIKVVGASVLRGLVRERPGRQVTVSILRQGRQLTVKPTLESHVRHDGGWSGHPGEVTRKAVRALRRVGGEFQDPDQRPQPGLEVSPDVDSLAPRASALRRQLEELDRLRDRLEALQEQLREEIADLRRELQGKTAGE